MDRLALAVAVVLVGHLVLDDVDAQRGSYNALPTPDADEIFVAKVSPTYVVTASRLIRPDSVYRLGVSLAADSPDLTIRAIIRNGATNIAEASGFFDAGTGTSLVMKIPPSLGTGQYFLKVEGFDPLRPQTAVFSKEEELAFSSQFLAIFIESNRKLYTNGMRVMMRILLMQMNLKPYIDPVTVFVLDPDGYIMRRWPSRYPRNGVVSLTYNLPPYPTEGTWTIRVEALAQVYERTFYVERYYLTFYELLPDAPVYVLDSDETYTAAMGTAFHQERVAIGNCTVRVYIKTSNGTDPFRVITEDYYPWSHDFSHDVDLVALAQYTPNNQVANTHVRVEFTITDYFLGETRVGYVDTRIIRAALKFRFAGTRTAVFKPGLPFHGHVYVTYEDDDQLEAEKLATARLTLRPTVTLNTGQTFNLADIYVPKQGEYLADLQWPEDPLTNWMERQAEDALFHSFRTTGVYQFRVAVPENAATLRIAAVYEDDSGDQASAELNAVAYYSPQEMYVQVHSSTDEGRIGESAVLHLKSNFGFESYQYVIISKGMVVYSTQQAMPHASRSTTFAVTVSDEMVPTFKVVAMVVTPTGDLIADSVTIPVLSLNRYKMNITLVQTRDHSKATVQLVTRTHAGSYIGINVLRGLNYYYQADSAVTYSRILKKLYTLEPFTRSVHGVTWINRQGQKPDRSHYFTAGNPGPDTPRTMAMAGLHVFTDARISQYPDTVMCDQSAGMNPCLVSGCFTQYQRCDGNLDCSDGSDEDDCPPIPDDRADFRLFRKNRFHDIYDWLDGDWSWIEFPITDDGEEFADQPVPITNEVWVFNGFSMHAELGFTMIDEAIVFDGTPQCYFAVEAPSSVRRGENLGIRMMGINNMEKEATVLFIIRASDDYKFIEIGPDGEVEHYHPKLVSGDKHHAVAMRPGGMKQVDIPIAPQIEQGTITVVIETVSQVYHQTHEVEIEVLPEGVTINRQTSMLLDLKNRAFLFRYLDIPVEETPVVPYSKYRRYVFGSPRATVTLCGDVFGPVFPEMPISTEALLRRSLRGTEAHLFNLAATTWSLHYLRLTNQLEADVMYEAFESMNVEMAGLMRLFDFQGSFKLNTNSRPSVWATAWVIRVLGQSQFQDWENHFFVDRKLIATCVQWLLGYQNEDGSFQETDVYSFPLDRRLSSNSSRSVGHTAHVVIGLHAVSGSLQGALKVGAANAKKRSAEYLQRQLNTLTDPYELAIVTHAFTWVNSAAKEISFGKLHSMRRENEGMVYWSREPVPSNNITYENQRPFVMPRMPNQQDAVAVETTAYALLVYLARDGIGDLQERVVTWLNTMRMVEGGFVSIFDSIVAMEALTEYAYRARLRDIAEMTVTIDPSASPDVQEVVHIDSSNLAVVHKIDVPNVWGHVNVIGRGAGQAVMQLNVQYGIDWDKLRDKPSKRYFELHVDETYSVFRNKSHIQVRPCVRWLALEEAPHSGTAVLEVEMPSGYGFVQTDGNAVLKKEEYPFLRDVLVAKNKVVWMYDYVGSEKTCFEYQLRRWYAVANMTQFRSAIVYETYSPEHFEMFIWKSLPLYALDICEVCGSFQCPYCPFYSSAPVSVPAPALLAACLGLALLFVDGRIRLRG